MKSTGYYFCFDGDRIGERVEQLLMSDDLLGAREFSQRVESAMDCISSQMAKLGARCVFRGGDSLVFHSVVGILEADIRHMVDGISFSVGVGPTVQSASLSLFKAKALGRSQIGRIVA